MDQMSGIGEGKEGDLGAVKRAAAGGGAGRGSVARLFFVFVVLAGALDEQFFDFRFG